MPDKKKQINSSLFDQPLKPAKPAKRKKSLKQVQASEKEAEPPAPAPQRQRVFSADEAILLASQHHKAGRLQKAEIILRQVLNAQPKNAKALHTFGLVALTAGNIAAAAKLVERAIKNKDDVAVYHANMAEICRKLKRLDDAIKYGRNAVSIDPALASAHSNLGIAYFDKKDFDKAEECQLAALKINPKFSPALNNMGSICREKKDDEKAAEYYRRAANANPENLEPQNNLGVILSRLDQLDESATVLKNVIAKSPNYAEAHCNLGFTLVAMEREREALNCFDKALQIRADYAEAYIGIAKAYNSMYELEGAEKAIEKALEINPDLAEAYSIAGVIYLSQGYAERAKESFLKALQIDPELSSAKQGIGNIYLEEGNFKEAEKIFQASVDSDKQGKLGALFSLTQTKKVKQGDKIIELLEDEAKNLKDLPESKAIYLHFALGKVYDDLGEHDKSFENFIEGCRLKRKKIHYDPKNSERTVERVKNVFTKEFIKKHSGKGYKSDVPIFVCGMPRSGTTLTEQIIASHPDVHGAGEIFDLLDIMNWRGKSGNILFPENIADCTPEKLKDIGKKYVSGLKARNKKALRITDKMPANYFHIGLIHLAMPEAKIIHVNRNPLDTCISCFTRLFSHNQNSTYDLKELGSYYRNYKNMIDHWHEVLPKGSFYDICYEDLVADTETEAKKLIEYCDLEWDDACLEFHKNTRNIRTASVTQVRQPIYNTSIERWRKYEKYLAPLLEGLGDSFATK